MPVVHLAIDIFNLLLITHSYALGLRVHDNIVTTPDKMMFASMLLSIKQLDTKKNHTHVVVTAYLSKHLYSCKYPILKRNKCYCKYDSEYIFHGYLFKD